MQEIGNSKSYDYHIPCYISSQISHVSHGSDKIKFQKGIFTPVIGSWLERTRECNTYLPVLKFVVFVIYFIAIGDYGK